jgi:predicted KAP-like P-loop ATPase
MAFDKETASKAGKKSKRNKGNEVLELRTHFIDLLTTNKENLQKWIDEVAETDPAKALELIIKMSAFVIPKLRTVELKNGEDESSEIIVTICKTRADVEKARE